MFNAFGISFSLKNTYRVNSIIYSIKQIPVIKKILPNSLYKSKGLKVFANIIAALWELITTFLGKAIYLACIAFAANIFYKTGKDYNVYVHIIFFLTIVGSYMNTFMFNPSRDKYYAMILMRMDARAYTLSNYCYSILKVFLGFLPFTVILGLLIKMPLWIGIVIPIFIVEAKLVGAWINLYRYKKTGKCTNENLPAKYGWTLAGLLIGLAYGLPYFGIVLPTAVFVALTALLTITGVYAAIQIFKFDSYREMYKILLSDVKSTINVKQNIQKVTEEQNRKNISHDTDISSNKSGFEYLNELFIKRHKKILWKSSKRVTAICILFLIASIIAVRVNSDIMKGINELMMIYLPYFVFVMYTINKGTAFTQALFMNCDHGMLSYSFYKKPKYILQLFKIRLREIIKINLLPASVIGVGLALILYFSGGTPNPINYAVIILSILAISIFFSVHYLTCYYLLQPYNINTEIKSSTYSLVKWITYMVCFAFIYIKMDTLIFGILAISFCVLYSIVACVLVYKYAYKTFKLRN